nr:MAG TPA: hypothetical protein [Caudoviricetes sp.]
MAQVARGSARAAVEGAGGYGRQLLGQGLAAPVGARGSREGDGGEGGRWGGAGALREDGSANRDGGSGGGGKDLGGAAVRGCAHASTVCRHT